MNRIAMFANKKQGAHIVLNKSKILPRQGYLKFLYDCRDKGIWIKANGDPLANPAKPWHSWEKGPVQS